MSNAYWATTVMSPSWSKVNNKVFFLDFSINIGFKKNPKNPKTKILTFFPVLPTRSGLQSPSGCSGCQQPLLQRPLQQLHQDRVRAALLSHTCLLRADPHFLLHREANDGRQRTAGGHVHSWLPPNSAYSGKRHGPDV